MRVSISARLLRGAAAGASLLALVAVVPECTLESQRAADSELDAGAAATGATATAAPFAPRSTAGMCMPLSTGSPRALEHAQTLDYGSYHCGCPNAINASTGAVARLFAGGDPAAHTDRVLLEDAMNGDAYEWRGVGATHPSDWLRIGGAARTYAYGTSGGVTSLYRLSGDGREDMQSLAAGHLGDQWERIGQGVATGLFTSAGGVFTPGFVISGAPATSALTLWQLTDASTLWWSEIDGAVNAGQATAYAASDSGIYKLGRVGSSGPAIYRYSQGGGWSAIGPATSGTLYAAGGTVFTVTTAGASSVVTRYTGTPNVWRDVSPGGVVRKIVGTPSTVFALLTNGIARLDPTAGTWSTVRSGADVDDVASGGASLFATTRAGRVLAFANGAWSDISCTGSASSAGCADACDPGPDVRGVAPSYADAAQQAQTSSASARHDVLTQHNDAARTGVMPSEDVLTPASVGAPGNFGFQRAIAVPGRVMAQPLYVESAAVVCDDGGGAVTNEDVAYVVTLENQVVALRLDPSKPSTCWAKTLGCPQTVWGSGCTNTAKDGSCLGNFAMGGQGDVRIGIVSTPVIDLAKSVMYVVARVRDGNDARGRYYVNALDTRTGAVLSRVEVIGDGLNGRSDCGNDGFRPSVNNNRAGLLLVNGTLFVAFSMSAGEDPANRYHGSVMAFDVSNPARVVERNASFCATPTTAGAGVWMAGGGLASDGSGAFFTTGNGAYAHQNADHSGDIASITGILDAPPAGEYPASFVRLDVASMRPLGFTDTRKAGENGLSTAYQMNDGVRPRSIFWARERSDADFGSGGVALIGHRVIGGGKDGILYVMDTATMSRVQSFQAFTDSGDPNVIYGFGEQYYGGPHIHGGPVIWNRSSATDRDAYVYGWSEKDHLRMFRYDTVHEIFEGTDAIDATPSAPLPVAHSDIVSREESMPGGMLSLSANGAQNGIVWAVVEEPFQECTQRASNGVVGPAPHCNVTYGEVPGRLYAFDAHPDADGRLRILWGDTATLRPNNAIPRYSKFAPPTVAHGRVLVPTLGGQLYVYGITHGSPPPKRFAGLAAAWNNGGNTSVAVYSSNGNAFTGWAQWNTLPGWDPTSIWLPGDFDGDGLADVATAWGNGATTTIAVRTSTGASLVPSTLVASTIPWSTSTRWLSGDFDGDGKSDVAAAFDCAGDTCVNVWNTTSLAPGYNATPSSGTTWIRTPGWDDTSQWVAGDFDGDGKADLATIWNSGVNTIAMRRSTGNTFTVGTWLANAGGWDVATQWLAGDFDGNGLTDLAAVWHNGGSTSVAVYPSNGQRFPGWAQWITTPGWDPTSQWVAGDFDGDGDTDVATMWNSGVNTIAMRRSTRSGFTLETWLPNGGGFSTTNRWVSGKFQ